MSVEVCGSSGTSGAPASVVDDERSESRGSVCGPVSVNAGCEGPNWTSVSSDDIDSLDSDDFEESSSTCKQTC